MARRRPTSFCLVLLKKLQLQLRVPTWRALGAKNLQTGLIRILAHHTHLHHQLQAVMERSARQNATAQGACWIAMPSHAAQRSYAGASVEAVTANTMAQVVIKTAAAMKLQPTLARAAPNRPLAMEINETDAARCTAGHHVDRK